MTDTGDNSKSTKPILQSMNIINTIHRRELGQRVSYVKNSFDRNSVVSHLDEKFNYVHENVQSLAQGVQSQKWSVVTVAVRSILNRLLDYSHSQNTTMMPIKKQEYEFFILLGGFDLLLKLFERPFVPSDLTITTFSNIDYFNNPRRVEVWNEILVILREISYYVQSSANLLFSQRHITFLFTLLAHPSVFESAMNLIEEVLSARLETFSLSLIPHFYKLVSPFK